MPGPEVTESVNGKENGASGSQKPLKTAPPRLIPPIGHPTPSDAFGVAANIKYQQLYQPHFTPLKFEVEQAYFATAQSVENTLTQRWNETYAHFTKEDPKQTYYLSMEFLQGRALTNALGNLGLTDAYAGALTKLGYDLESIAEQEKDMALGNGGLGRLASCFLDSFATLNLPAWGYGLRYKYGLFSQRITKKGQEEVTEDWLEKFSPWEIVRHDVVHPVRFFGEVQTSSTGKKTWVGGEVVQALAYDVPIPGYKTKNCISLRLWDARATNFDFDLQAFNAGDYEKAAHAHAKASEICLVLYPGDATEAGKLLRLKQQYLLCSASMQDIVARFKERRPRGQPIVWSEFPHKVAVQMNDTHPTLSIPELMRILLDEENLPWNEAWEITSSTCAYTNHTVLPEALEKWSQVVMTKLLPRHMEIIKEIDKQFVELVKTQRPELEGQLQGLRVLDDNPEKPVARMANLCVVSAHAVNGVAEIHSKILVEELFAGYYALWPHKFQNKTNGITPRRWIRFCSPELSAIITKWLGTDEWVQNLDLLTGLRQHADDRQLHEEWAAAKKANKLRLAEYLLDVTGVRVNPDSLFDTQIKRIHEYKRQLLNILGVIYRYKKLKEMSPEERQKCVPRTVMLGGKAFATYLQAKRIVKLVTDIGATVNNDPEIGDLLKVVFIPNYNVTVAEMVIPASELSQHISTAGMEASGTSNMKFALNGCLIIGTLDGANVEIREEIGEENFFLFGARADEVAGLRKDRADGKFTPDPRFEEAKDFVRKGTFGDFDYTPLLESLEGNSGYGRADYFLVGHDFPTYIEAQERVDEAYQNKDLWNKMSILSTAGSGKFSSDRTIKQYAKDIWNIKECIVP